MLLQIFGFYFDFIGALSVGYTRKAEPWKRRGGKKREKEKYFLQIMSDPVDAAVLLSGWHVLSAPGSAGAGRSGEFHSERSVLSVTGPCSDRKLLE